MKPLAQACTPRKTVFDRARRDVVLDISDLIEDRLKPAEFFEENYITDGMRQLLIEAFRRFKGESDQGVFKLTQAMGGGKTHNMVALGLLAGWVHEMAQRDHSFSTHRRWQDRRKIAPEISQG
jgi:predicted AAA+ superfamily ATPase